MPIVCSMPALCRPRMNAPGSVTMGRPHAIASRLVLPPDQRSVSSITSHEAFTARNSSCERCARNRSRCSPMPARAEAIPEFRGECAVASFVCDEDGVGNRVEHAREQRIVRRMDLEERLRTQQERNAFGQSDPAAIARWRSGRRRIPRADTRQCDQPLRVVRGAVRRLHARARKEYVDRRQARRHRVAPARALYGRETKRRERERDGRHAELRVHEDVRRIFANARRDLRRTPSRAMAKVVRARGDALAERVEARHEVIDVHLEAVARKIGDPALEVASGRAVAKERAYEADLHARPARRA